MVECIMRVTVLSGQKVFYLSKPLPLCTCVCVCANSQLQDKMRFENPWTVNQWQVHIRIYIYVYTYIHTLCSVHSSCLPGLSV